jgi:hypothetical protein
MTKCQMPYLDAILSASRPHRSAVLKLYLIPNTRCLRPSARGVGACSLGIAGTSSATGTCRCYESSFSRAQVLHPFRNFLTNMCRYTN